MQWSEQELEASIGENFKHFESLLHFSGSLILRDLNQKKTKKSNNGNDQEEEDQSFAAQSGKNGSKQAQSAQELHQRLEKKIEKLNSSRIKKNAPSASSLNGSGAAARQTKKERREEKKKKKRKMKKDEIQLNRSSVEIERKLSESVSSKKNNQASAIQNQEGKLVFSKFDFQTDSTKGSLTNNKKKSDNVILHEIKKEKEKLNELSQTDPEKAKAMKDKATWRTALQRAKGEKVKDRPDLLERSIRRKKKAKERSQVDWQERVKKIEEQKQEKQEKRKAHIDARKDAKKKTKVKRLQKKGRLIPGF